MAEAQDTVAGENHEDIFEGVYFAIIDLPEEETKTVTQNLEKHGATHTPLSSTKLSNVTHLIAKSSDFPAYHDAIEAFIHVVKPSWVTQSILKNRVANPRQFSPDPALFLSDVNLTCASDIPEGDKDAIIGGVLAMGGQYSPVMTKAVTHVVALTTDNPQYKMIVEKNLRCKPILPHWFDDCLKLGKKIGLAPYQLPNPPILSRDEDVQDKPVKSILPSLIKGASSITPTPDPTTGEAPTSPSKSKGRKFDVFRNRSVMLDFDLGLTPRLRHALFDLITEGCGSIVTEIEDADMLICQMRENERFKTAIDDGKDVGNLSWLYYLVQHNKWTAPTKRLLHFPFPKNGIPGFQDLKVSVSNYTGEARVYIENLVKAAGGTFTKTMTQDNTHLITGHTFSEKCTAAKEWNINIVNHLWLEESYAKGKIQSLTDPKYTTFPSRTNLGEVVGQTPIDRTAFGMTSNGATELRPVGAEVKNMQEESKPAKTPKTPLNRVRRQDDKENQIPDSGNVGSSGRGAKSRALNKLHAMAPDIALFEKETKRAGGVIYGGRRVTDPDRVDLSKGKKRDSMGNEKSTSPSVEPAPADEQDETKHTKKKQRKSAGSLSKANGEAKTEVPTKKNGSKAPQRLKVLVTGYEKFSAPSYNTVKGHLRKLNITFVEKPDDTLDVVCVTRILRTRKFVSSIAYAPAVLRAEWLEDCARRGERLPFDGYRIHDEAGEREGGFTLEDALERARAWRSAGGMFSGWTIFCTENVKGGFESYDDIVRANGGVCQKFTGREKQVVQNAAADEPIADGAKISPQTHLILLSDSKDKHLWSKFRSVAAKGGFQPLVLRHDWILRAATAQDPDIDVEAWIWEDASTV